MCASQPTLSCIGPAMIEDGPIPSLWRDLWVVWDGMGHEHLVHADQHQLVPHAQLQTRDNPLHGLAAGWQKRPLSPPRRPYIVATIATTAVGVESIPLDITHGHVGMMASRYTPVVCENPLHRLGGP